MINANVHSAHNAYRAGAVAAAAPLRIVILLYEGASRFCHQARDQFDDPTVRGQALGRAHRIVSELLSALDHEQGKEIAQNLDGLYHYVLGAITRANVGLERPALDSAINVLCTLLEGWRGIEARGVAPEATP